MKPDTRRHARSTSSSSLPTWLLTAPTTISADVVPLGLLKDPHQPHLQQQQQQHLPQEHPSPPTSPTSSPRRGSAVSRARWSTTVPVQSVRHRKSSAVSMSSKTRASTSAFVPVATVSTTFPDPSDSEAGGTGSGDNGIEVTMVKQPQSPSRTSTTFTSNSSHSSVDSAPQRSSSTTLIPSGVVRKSTTITNGMPNAAAAPSRRKATESRDDENGKLDKHSRGRRVGRSTSSNGARDGAGDSQLLRISPLPPPFMVAMTVNTTSDGFPIPDEAAKAKAQSVLRSTHGGGGWTSATLPPSSPRPGGGGGHKKASCHSVTDEATSSKARSRIENETTSTDPDFVLDGRQHRGKDKQQGLDVPKKKSSRRDRHQPPTDQILLPLVITGNDEQQRPKHHRRGRSVSRQEPFQASATTVAQPSPPPARSSHATKTMTSPPLHRSRERSDSCSSQPRGREQTQFTAAAHNNNHLHPARSSSQPPQQRRRSTSVSRERSTSRSRPVSAASSSTASASLRGGRSTSQTRGSSRPTNAAAFEKPATRPSSNPRTRSQSTERRHRSSSQGSSRHHTRTRSASLTRMAASPTAAAASSSNHRRGHQRPPSTYRTRQELLRGNGGGGSNSGGGVSLVRVNSMGGGGEAGGSSSSHSRQQQMQWSARNRSASESDAKSSASWGEWHFGNGADLTSHGSTGSNPLLGRGVAAKKSGGLREKLFGDPVASPRAAAASQQRHFQRQGSNHRLVDTFAGGGGPFGPNEIRPRILLAATVYHNTATNLWIATINTNQRGVAKNPTTANKFLKAFSFATEREARESAIANAPPKMVPFGESPACSGCQGKFAVFRRAAHCRNCGVCVCSSCSTTWHMNMIPSTYNLKNETNVKICRSCHSLHVLFKKALLHGDLEEAIALYETGNINLRSPFAVSNKKDETMYPVHCAAEGGNLHLLRWLLEDHYCPISMYKSAANRGGPKRGGTGGGGGHGTDQGGSNSMETSILTSKGRSVLTIAMENLKVDMMRYLVVERSVSIYECKDVKSALAALEATLTSLPYARSPCEGGGGGGGTTGRIRSIPSVTRWDRARFDDTASDTSSLGVDDHEQQPHHNVDGNYHDQKQPSADCESNGRRSRTASTSGSVNGTVGGGGECIICFERRINCVATPCGHQVCCLECCSSLAVCPVCNGKATFIKIFRP